MSLQVIKVLNLVHCMLYVVQHSKARNLVLCTFHYILYLLCHYTIITQEQSTALIDVWQPSSNEVKA